MGAAYATGNAFQASWWNDQETREEQASKAAEGKIMTPWNHRAWNAHLQAAKDRAIESEAAKWARRRQADREEKCRRVDLLHKKANAMLALLTQQAEAKNQAEISPPELDGSERLL